MKRVYFLYFALLFLSHQAINAQIVNIEERRIKGTNDSTFWYGSLRLGANISKVKDQVLQFNSTGHVQYKKGRSLTLLLLDGNFLRAGNRDFQEAAFSHLRFNYKLKEWLVTETFVQAQYNKLLLINLRALAGAGLRFQLLKSQDGKQRIYGGTAYLFEKNQYTDEIPNKNWHRLSSYISFTFRPSEGVTLVSTTYFQPTLSDVANYRLSTEWRLDTPLGKKLSFFSNFTFSRDKSLPDGAPRSVYAWLNGLAYKF
ncbi:MAG: DUF481 domain-containing protein [Saprospiraceae bacterium]